MSAELRYPHSITVLFRPAMHPADRGDFEDELEESLEKEGLGELTGGGTAMDGSFCDIGIDVADIPTGLRVIRQVLKRCEAPQSTVIISGEKPQRVEHRVYE